jgi:tetratricopeptide (TPR) repeat protein
MRYLLVSVLLIGLMACTSDKEEALEHFKAGKKLLYANDVNGALEELNKSIELDPGSSDAFYFRGNAKMNLRDYKGAIDDFNACLNLNPNYTDAWVNRGNAKFIQDDRLGACKDWTKAKELGKENIAERLMNCN